MTQSDEWQSTEVKTIAESGQLHDLSLHFHTEDVSVMKHEAHAKLEQGIYGYSRCVEQLQEQNEELSRRLQDAEVTGVGYIVWFDRSLAYLVQFSSRI